MLWFRAERDARRLIVVGRGELTLRDVETFLEQQIKDGYWEFGILYDVRLVTRTLNSEELAELVEFIAFVTRNLPPRGPVAVLTTAAAMADTTAEYARLGLRAGLRVRAFSDEAEAVSWLEANTAPEDLRFVGPGE